MQNVVLTQGQISSRLKQVLNLPPDTWQLVINKRFTVASFMDRNGRVRHLDIDDLTREKARRSLALGDAAVDAVLS